MSRGTALAAGIAGALVGAAAGIPYLLKQSQCADVGPASFQCTMNTSLGPFLSAIAIGIVVAMVIGNAIAVMTKRSMVPKAAEHPAARDAVDIDDPAIQIAAWGMPPGASQRTVSLSEPAAARPRPARPPLPSTSGRPPGAGYGAARQARAAMLVGR